MSEIYTITEQYHEQKDIYIWVVRIIPKIEKDVFIDLRSRAKDWDGYYSTFRGVNGFVFQTEGDAHNFVDSLSDYIDIPCEEISEPEIEESISNKRKNKKTNVSKEKNYKKVELTPSKKPLHEALREVVDKEGKEILTDLRLINILDDYKAFEEIPSSKFILKSIIEKGYIKFLFKDTTKEEIAKFIKNFSYLTGISNNNLEKIVKIILYGINNSFLESQNYNDLIIQSNQIDLINKRWSKEMSDIQTNKFFYSIMECDSNKKKNGLIIEHIEFYVDESSFLNIICRCYKSENIDKKTHGLYCKCYDFNDKVIITKQIIIFYRDEIGYKEDGILIYELAPNEISKIKFYWE